MGNDTRIHESLGDGDRFMGIRLLGALDIASGSVAGLPLAELSGLAVDPDDGTLYAVGDEGVLFTFRLEFEGSYLRGLHALSATRLRDRNGFPLNGAEADAEGLAWLPTTRTLLVSFERKHRLAEYRTDGSLVRVMTPPADVFPMRSRNKGLEGVTLQDGAPLTGPEQPPADAPDAQYRIVRGDGIRFTLPRLEPDAGGLTALQTLRDGRVLALERVYHSMWAPLVIRLYTFGPTPDDPVHLVAELDNGKGWSVDNFEGLAQLPDGRLLMVSDDNNSPLQRTVLLCFELLDQSPK